MFNRIISFGCEHLQCGFHATILPLTKDCTQHYALNSTGNKLTITPITATDPYSFPFDIHGIAVSRLLPFKGREDVSRL